MILNSVTIFAGWKHPRRTSCFACADPNINTKQLREELDHLHKDAESTRAKANNARLRMMRLAEAAEKLRRQAAINIQAGKENDAREMLFQKKKVMQAMEKSKSRIELLDDLAAKLNEVLSIKETQLIGNIALHPESGLETASSPIRIISPPQKGPESIDKIQDRQKSLNDQSQLDQEVPEKTRYQAGMIGDLQEISSYENFLEHIDQQLNEIEVELVTAMKFPALLREGEEMPENLKMQQTEEILEGIRHVRSRIASMTRIQSGIS